MAAICPLEYALEIERKVHWSGTQESAISTEFPFDLHNELPEAFVHRTYLQFLWLPEQLMPLRLLATSMRRMQAASASDTHPLHALLDELLLTVPSMKAKYRTELQRILINGGGAGDVEEAMMWYAITHEHADIQEPWLDVPWREQYLERLERREVQIQIILYLLKLSLPALPKSKGKRRRGSSPEITAEEYLESFFDVLSMWQLLNGVQKSSGEVLEERDWMQTFCADVVEPEFKSSLPDLCQLLRSKIFPQSHDSDVSTTRASSPAEELPARPMSRAPSRAASKVTDARALARERSRSLSVSLAQEREQSAANQGKRRMGTREISMSRVFKPKPKPTTVPKPSEKQQQESQTQTQLSRSQSKFGMTLVEETPAKATTRDRTVSTSIFPSTSSRGLFGNLHTDNDDAWQIESSPDIMLLASPGKEEEDEDEDMCPATPSRPSRAAKTRPKVKAGKRK